MRKACFFLLLFSAVPAVVAAAQPRIVHGDDVSRMPFPGHDTALLADAASTPGAAAVLELDLPPRTFGAPPHIHAREDEFFYVVQGQVEFLDRDQRQLAGPGSLVVLPRGHLHGFWNPTDTPAKMLLIVTPGEFASFFDDVVAEIERTNADTPERIGELIARAAAAREVEVRMDALPAGVMESLAD